MISSGGRNPNLFQAAIDKSQIKLFFWPKSLAIAIVGIIIVGGMAGCTSFQTKCDRGLQKIDGQCIDPYFLPFQKAQKQGDEAVKLAQNYQTIEDLQQAQSSLARVFRQLNQIPPSARVFQQAQDQLQAYKSQPIEINTKLQNERVAQQQLTAVREAAKQAASATSKAQSTAQLNNAKRQWQDTQTKLKAIATDTLLATQIQQLQLEYQTKVAEIDRRIASITKQNKARVVPQKNRPRAISKPRPKPRPRTKPKYTPKPRIKPSDPCAVANPPANCLF